MPARTWIPANTGLGTASDSINALAVSGTYIFAGTQTSGVFRSTNSGANWALANNGVTNSVVYSFAVAGTRIYAGTAGGIFVSTDGGANWVKGTGVPGSAGYVAAITAVGTNVFAGTYNDIYRSTDDGATWSALNSGLYYSYSLCNIGTKIYAGMYGGGVYVSTNGGTTWGAAGGGSANGYVNALATDGTGLYAGTNAGVFCLPGGAGTWKQVTTGMPALKVSSFATSNGNLLAGTAGGGVWMRKPSEMSVPIPEYGTPTHFSLSQNYPNPFNPSTTIRYGLPSRSHVSLTVFNALGQQVSLLQSGEQDAGYHEVKFDAQHLPSGVYFYRMQTGNFTETKRLLLLR